MNDVRLTATNPEDSSVVPVLCNAKGELKLEEPIIVEGPPGQDGQDAASFVPDPNGNSTQGDVLTSTGTGCSWQTPTRSASFTAWSALLQPMGQTSQELNDHNEYYSAFDGDIQNTWCGFSSYQGTMNVRFTMPMAVIIRKLEVAYVGGNTVQTVSINGKIDTVDRINGWNQFSRFQSEELQSGDYITFGCPSGDLRISGIRINDQHLIDGQSFNQFQTFAFEYSLQKNPELLKEIWSGSNKDSVSERDPFKNQQVRE